jgi:SnoaL-like domain
MFGALVCREPIAQEEGIVVIDIHARLEIQDMLFRYCRGLDRMDKPLALSVFHPESELDIEGAFKGSGIAFVDWVWEQHNKALRHSHNITNVYVEIAGETAASEAYVMMVMHVATPGGMTLIQGHGRYLDEWVRYEQRWVIKKRRATREFQEVRQLAAERAPGAPALSRRDGTDPSYDLRPRLNFF